MTDRYSQPKIVIVKETKGKGRTRRQNRRAPYQKLPPGQWLSISFLLAICLGFLQSAPAGTPTIYPENKVFAPVEPPFKLAQCMSKTCGQLNNLCGRKTKLDAGIFAIEPDTGRYINCQGNKLFSAASLIKIPVFVDLLMALDKKQVDLNQDLVLKPEFMADGSGWLKWRQPGTTIKLQEAAELMMIISDNTATNLIIDLLGGIEKVNQDIKTWGLTSTQIHNLLPDLSGTNITSPYDLVYLLGCLDRGYLLLPESRQYLFTVMERTKIRTLLPPGLEPGSRIAHKTGDIASMVGDAGVVTLPSRRHYIVAVQVTRSCNDRRANELIRTVSRMVAQSIQSSETSNLSQTSLLPGTSN